MYKNSIPTASTRSPLYSFLPDAGFSLMEVLASLVIVFIALAALTPSLILAAATRVHTQRIENATNLAYQQLDGTRAILERGAGTYASGDLPSVESSFDLAPPAGDIANLGGYYVQTFRDAGVACPPPNNATPCVFTMGVRVYSDLAFPSGSYAGSTDVTPISGNVTGVQSVLQAKEQPLVSIISEISSQTTLQQYNQYLTTP